jgi:hypothetical protein
VFDGRDHNETLREQLEAERQTHAEARRIIAGLVERIPALEPWKLAKLQPSEKLLRRSRSPRIGQREPRSDATGPQEDVQRRPWWSRVRRLFGG